MAISLTYYEGLGIETWDLVSTSYNSGPYRVTHVSRPTYWFAYIGGAHVTTYPTISITGISPDHQGPIQEWHQFYLNNVRREGDRWFAGDDEIYLEKADARPAMEMPDLFSATADDPCERPYAFQNGVNYRVEDGLLWHCHRCARDFNTAVEWGTRDKAWRRPDCPHCGYPSGGVPMYVDGLEAA